VRAYRSRCLLHIDRDMCVDRFVGSFLERRWPPDHCVPSGATSFPGWNVNSHELWYDVGGILNPDHWSIVFPDDWRNVFAGRGAVERIIVELRPLSSARQVQSQFEIKR